MFGSAVSKPPKKSNIAVVPEKLKFAPDFKAGRKRLVNARKFTAKCSETFGKENDGSTGKLGNEAFKILSRGKTSNLREID